VFEFLTRLRDSRAPAQPIGVFPSFHVGILNFVFTALRRSLG